MLPHAILIYVIFFLLYILKKKKKRFGKVAGCACRAPIGPSGHALLALEK